jgi:hypothetical protein
VFSQVSLPSHVLALTGGPAEAALSVVVPLTGVMPFAGSPHIVSPATVYADEVGPTGLLTLEACLRYFERNRTDFIGGADGLKALQEVMSRTCCCRVDWVRGRVDDMVHTRTLSRCRLASWWSSHASPTPSF